MSVLLQKIYQLHSTELGIARICRNLGVDPSDAVSYCRQQILSDGAEITREGKNWYITTSSCRITVNASSLTIITAHRV